MAHVPILDSPLAQAAVSGFEAAFGARPQALFSAPGRTELGGNHTDHQHGRVLAAAVDLAMVAAVSANDSGLLRLHSEGYAPVEVALDKLTPAEGETGTTAALVRGVAARMKELGCPLDGVGLDAFVVSAVPAGSGLSSSAAFEVLVGTMLNELFWDGTCAPVELAQIGQWAENHYFGKPCGLMDQTACSVGGVVAIDFADPSVPVVEQIELDLTAAGYALCILDSGADHADLTGEYAAITEELAQVSGYFGKTVLREVAEEAFRAAIPQLRRTFGDRAVLRAHHFYGETRRAEQQALALKRGDFDGFLELVRQSGRSSALYLQNVTPTGESHDQSLLLTLALCEEALEGRGAARVHGGGFGGTAQAFVPLDLLNAFRTRVEAVLGPGSCHTVTVRPVGGCRLL